MDTPITAEDFRRATGHEPQNDDLDRANCPLAGKFGHSQCGWNHQVNLPVFMAGPEPPKPVEQKRMPSEQAEAIVQLRVRMDTEPGYRASRECADECARLAPYLTEEYAEHIDALMEQARAILRRTAHDREG